MVMIDFSTSQHMGLQCDTLQYYVNLDIVWHGEGRGARLRPAQLQPELHHLHTNTQQITAGTCSMLASSPTSRKPAQLLSQCLQPFNHDQFLDWVHKLPHRPRALYVSILAALGTLHPRIPRTRCQKQDCSS